MNVLRHWLVYGLGHEKPWFATWDEGEAAQYRDSGYRVDGPFVPESEQRGAVDALREAAMALREYGQHRPGCSGGIHGDTISCACGLSDAISCAGGQCEQPATKDTTAEAALQEIGGHGGPLYLLEPSQGERPDPIAAALKLRAILDRYWGQ